MSRFDGFSRLSREEKIRIISGEIQDKEGFAGDLNAHLHPRKEIQQLYRDLSENVISNFFLPFSVAPHFVINGKSYVVPMVTEESSVVAATASGAKYWADRGGFHARVISKIKAGHIHFLWRGNKTELFDFFQKIRKDLHTSVNHLTRNMKERGGGITSLSLSDKTGLIPDYFQIEVKFDTCNSMGANFINSVLEKMAAYFKNQAEPAFGKNVFELIMSILSNHAPESLTEVYAECDISVMSSGMPGMKPVELVKRIKLAVEIANCDMNRAVTHNKGIFNGMDAVVIATGNDFRAVEAQGHAWAVKDGKYSSLSSVHADDKTFRLILQIPLTVGTVGGLTGLHPLAKRSLELLGNPGADELMKVIASAGLAVHFSSLKSLVTKGIQEGHMRMHLINILRSNGISDSGLIGATEYFKNKKITHAAVTEYLKNLRPKE